MTRAARDLETEKTRKILTTKSVSTNILCQRHQKNGSTVLVSFGEYAGRASDSKFAARPVNPRIWKARPTAEPGPLTSPEPPLP